MGDLCKKSAALVVAAFGAAIDEYFPQLPRESFRVGVVTANDSKTGLFFDDFRDQICIFDKPPMQVWRSAATGWGDGDVIRGKKTS